MAKPPDFSIETIRTLAKRAGEVCSKPDCNQATGGPHTDPTKSTNLGEAAHIRGARLQANNRFDPNMTDEERAQITNGIWLCCTHAKEIDTDEKRFPVELLLRWKEGHEFEVLAGPGLSGRPPLIVYRLHFSLLQNRQVRLWHDGTESFQMDFMLVNLTKPSQEVHNIFGTLWIDGAHFIASSSPPSRGYMGAPRVEWDMLIPILPREAAFEPASSVVRMPRPGEEVLVGAQFVSKETEKQEYFWHMVNDSGVPKAIFIKYPHPHNLKPVRCLCGSEGFG